MLAKNVCWRKTCMLVKTNFFFQEDTFHQHTEKFSPTYFTNIHLNFCSKFSPTYSTFHQHTEFFSPTYFTNIHLNFCLHQHTASPTYRKFFTNILFFTNIFHQHHHSLTVAIVRITVTLFLKKRTKIGQKTQKPKFSK